MQELSLHILDVARNSIEAGATRVEITVVENDPPGHMEIVVHDNGAGMDPSDARRATDPFFTTRTTRRVGLGLALFAATCEACDGAIEVTSQPGAGTTVRARLRLDHLDRPPLGDMGAVMQALALEAERVSLSYRHCTPVGEFALDTHELQERLDGARLTDPSVLKWLREFVNEGLKAIDSKA